MTSVRRRAACLAGALILSGCARLPGFAPVADTPRLKPPPAVFQMEARVSVKAEAESFSGGLSWRRERDLQTLLLRTPLGQGIAELHGDASGMVLTDARGQTRAAADADSLARQALGVDLPVRGLQWWVVGQPRPDAAYRARVDGEGRLSGLVQDGWDIEFGRYRAIDGHSLPGRLIARRGDDLEVRLVVDLWELR